MRPARQAFLPKGEGIGIKLLKVPIDEPPRMLKVKINEPMNFFTMLCFGASSIIYMDFSDNSY